MIRFAWIILAFAALGAGMVHLRLQQASAQAETYRLQAHRHEVRRTLWNQQIHLGEQVSPQHMKLRGREFALKLLPPGERRDGDRIARRD